MRRLGFTTLCLIISMFPCYSSTLTALRLEVDGDSLWIGAGKERMGVPITMFTGTDTIGIQEDTAIWLSSLSDSVLVVKTARFVPVTISFPTKNQLVVFHFDSFHDQLQDRLELLRQYSDFGRTSGPNGMAFKYSYSTDSGLTELRTKYKLDQVAGTGSEVSRMLNLLRWAHRIVRHDGNSLNPSGRNALNLIQVCTDSSRGVNCRMIATILNEACLSMGFKSRHLTCLPWDKKDTDCHVVNMVWSDSLNKWIYLDPSFNGYFQDATGQMLSPLEIRSALMNNDSILISPELDYNGQPHSTVQYRAYMAKNLFRFSSPVESAFNYESRSGELVWVYLNPFGYDAHLTARADTIKSGANLHIDHYCDNAKCFFGN